MGHTHAEVTEKAQRFYSKTGFEVNWLRYKPRGRVVSYGFPSISPLF